MGYCCSIVLKQCNPVKSSIDSQWLPYRDIRGLYAEPTYRRQRIATWLMQTAIDCIQVLLYALDKMLLKIDVIRLI
ncbi:hypothetical protein [Leptolyngbya sp. NIES-2104]|uniref:hypothetical protein n=1 Tax=Leptolyngbya sp. NIES-2104 TaxID=1552121 RepID=UPI0006EC9F34|nr:hypothetical protein [Leptolyngbya sp. NIES-2104]GAP97474.1 hypothetical protein NIES2104_40210 [Leptolyngbya sp. NIES-2104]